MTARAALPDLPPDLTRFVEERVEAGDYASAEDVLREGVKLLKFEREAKLERLRAAIQIGLDELDRGEGVDVAWDDLDSWLEGLDRAAPIQ